MTFKLGGVLLRFTDYQSRVTVEAETLPLALEGLVDEFPELRGVLFDREGGLRATHRLFLNGEMLTRAEVSRPVRDDDRVDILTAISGG